MPNPTVAIVGRPNVGKSTLFNRLVGKRVALVDDRPGVMRDRREGGASLIGLEFRVIDTAGFEDEDPVSLPGRMRLQTEMAVRDADVALFLIDAREGVTALDEEIGRWLRAEATPVLVVAVSRRWRFVVANPPLSPSKRRLPEPAMTGWIISRYSSMSLRRVSSSTRSPLP